MLPDLRVGRRMADSPLARGGWANTKNAPAACKRTDQAFDNDVVGTFRLLEAARERDARFLFMSTCMVYDRAATADRHRAGWHRL